LLDFMDDRNFMTPRFAVAHVKVMAARKTRVLAKC